MIGSVALEIFGRLGQRYRNAVRNARAMPGADVYSDHVLVVAKLKLHLKRLIPRKKAKSCAHRFSSSRNRTE